MAQRKPALNEVVRNTEGRILRIKGRPGAIPKHLKDLRIPPAWTDVQVNADPNAKLFVVGYDIAGRQQRIYSSMHTEKAASQKFKRVRRLLECREDIRSQIEYDLLHSEWSEEALVAYLIYETGIRPGSDRDTKAAKTAFGATTLQARHIKPKESGRVYLTFTGKKGVVNSLKVTNPHLVKELLQRKEAAEGIYTTPVFNTTDNLVRQYMDALTDGEFTPKDLRAMRANLLAIELSKGRRVPSSETKRKKLVREIVKKVSDVMGHSPAVCRNAYIDPMVFTRFSAN